jgi:hypothetical protein|tara:strand:- start:6153 stop:6551 length:399 start_codon:yes stop_codon:yes gene_type:complete
MPFPTSLKPTSRTFGAGEYPVKAFRAQNGTEVRILYGSRRTNMKLSLTYENISDANAELFVTHYDEMKGSLHTFGVASPDDLAGGAKTGWSGTPGTLGASSQGASYRYEGAPQITQVRSGISTVTVNLIGVL